MTFANDIQKGGSATIEGERDKFRGLYSLDS